MSARINLTLSLRGPDLVGVARGLHAKGWTPSELPERLRVDDQSAVVTARWFEDSAARAQSELRAAWPDDSFFVLSPELAIVKLDRRLLDLDLRGFVDGLAAIPFETAVLAPRRFERYYGERPREWWHGHGLTGSHYQAGWGIALRGEGHLHLVSRRFLTHGGPWRVLAAPNDTTVIQFHDLAAADPVTAWAQAKPCVERLTYQPALDTCGLVDVAEDVYAPSGATYDAPSKTLWITTGDRTIGPREMRDAAEDRFNARVKPGKWRALEKVAYVFPSEAAARAHLQDLWLRELECWYESAGRRVRLDDAHQPAPPAPPAWVAQAETPGKRPSEPPKPPGQPPKPPVSPAPPVAPKPTLKPVTKPEPAEDAPIDDMPTGDELSEDTPAEDTPPDISDLAEQPAPANISAFSEKLYLPEMRRNDARKAALVSAIATVRGPLSVADQKRLDQVAFAIARVDVPGPRVDYAGVNENDMLFSASLLKVALLYASFELAARVNALAPTLTATSPADFFTKVGRAFGTEIASSIPFIPAGAWQSTQFAKILTATAGAPGRYSVDLSQTHHEDLVNIFARQRTDDGARNCVRRLGFSYVNGALAAGGFLSVKNKSGIWLATDYLADGVKDGWPFVYVPVDTGGKSSVAMTALAMAHLVTAMHRRELVNAASSDDMVHVFSGPGAKAAWLSLTTGAASMSFAVTGAKVGHLASSDAKVGVVKSEAALLKRTRDNTPFVAVWQNFPEERKNGGDDTLPVYRVIDEVVKNWP